MFRNYRLRDYNFRLIILLIVISVIGVLLVGSADPSLQRKQMLGVLGGFAIMIVISLIDYSWVLNFYWVMYGVNLLLLLFVMLNGAVKKGASRWIQIGGFQFQPTELSKIILILFFAMFFMKYEERISSLHVIVRAALLIGVPLLLVLRQPDLKNTITITVIFAAMYYAAGLSYKAIGFIILMVLPVILALFFLITQTDIHIIDDYQKERIMTFINREDNEYTDSRIQQDNSIMAIGSGQLTGKGLNNDGVSSANKGNFIAETQNDFIFAVAGEETGFIGCTTIIVILFLIVFECIRTGQRAKDLAGSMICTGMAALVGFQSFLNICVASGLMPNTGTTLPFVSYGITSLWCCFIGMGFVLNVSLQRRIDYGIEYGGDILNEHIPYELR